MHLNDAIKSLFESLNGARRTFTQLINASSNAPKDVKTLQSLMGDRVKDYLGNTYRIFEDNSVLPLHEICTYRRSNSNTKEFLKDMQLKMVKTYRFSSTKHGRHSN